jgi:hypothetical protein
MIAEHVWDYSFDSFTNIIDVYVNYLRKKVDREMPSCRQNTSRFTSFDWYRSRRRSPSLVPMLGFHFKMQTELGLQILIASLRAKS